MTGGLSWDGFAKALYALIGFDVPSKWKEHVPQEYHEALGWNGVVFPKGD